MSGKGYQTWSVHLVLEMSNCINFMLSKFPRHSLFSHSNVMQYLLYLLGAWRTRMPAALLRLSLLPLPRSRGRRRRSKSGPWPMTRPYWLFLFPLTVHSGVISKSPERRIMASSFSVEAAAAASEVRYICLSRRRLTDWPPLFSLPSPSVRRSSSGFLRVKSPREKKTREIYCPSSYDCVLCSLSVRRAWERGLCRLLLRSKVVCLSVKYFLFSVCRFFSRKIPLFFYSTGSWWRSTFFFLPLEAGGSRHWAAGPTDTVCDSSNRESLFLSLLNLVLCKIGLV